MYYYNSLPVEEKVQMWLVRLHRRPDKLTSGTSNTNRFSPLVDQGDLINGRERLYDIITIILRFSWSRKELVLISMDSLGPRV